MSSANIKNKRNLNKAMEGIFYLILTVGALTMLLPFAWMILTALKTQSEAVHVPPIWIPSNPRWENFLEVIRVVPIGRYYFNSLFMAVTSVLSVLFTSSIAGFIFAKHNAVGLKIIFPIILSTMMIPYFVLLIPLYIFIVNLGLSNTYIGLILPGMVNTFCLFLMRQHIATIPSDLIDAARIDGCSEFRVYWQIILPLSKAVLGTIAIFVFMWNWQSLIWPLIITTSDKMRPIVVALTFFSDEHTDSPNLVMAMGVVIIAPVIMVFMFMQRQFVKAMTLTGFK